MSALGFATDLMVHRAGGADIRFTGPWTIVRTRRNPHYYRGNFLLVGATALDRDPAEWAAAFILELPDVEHLAIGLDAAHEADVDTVAIAAAGLEMDIDRVLVATRLVPPVHPAAVGIRPISSESDWQQVRRLWLDTSPLEESAANRLFEERRLAQAREMCNASRAVWWGAWVGRRLGAILGVVSDGTGVARYQHVVTHPSLRRRGIAGTLVHTAGAHAIEHMGAGRIVIVADPTGPAIGIYRALGFSDSEDQLSLERRDPASVASPR